MSWIARGTADDPLGSVCAPMISPHAERPLLFVGKRDDPTTVEKEEGKGKNNECFFPGPVRRSHEAEHVPTPQHPNAARLRTQSGGPTKLQKAPARKISGPAPGTNCPPITSVVVPSRARRSVVLVGASSVQARRVAKRT